MTLYQALSRAESALSAAGVEQPRLEAETLLMLQLGAGRSAIYARLKDNLDDRTAEGFFALAGRRAAREPGQYITGEAYFSGLKFMVSPAVLIPRPETEALADEGAALLKDREDALIADLGTGSGCIAVTLALKLSGARVLAVDKSPDALELAKRNAALHGVGGRVGFLLGDMLGPLYAGGYAGGLDLIVSNPPYVPSAEMPGLQPEVRCEPASALDGGPDGLVFIRRIIGGAPGCLKAGGWLLMEIGMGQAEAVREIVHDEPGLAFIRFIEDFAGIERVLAARRPF